LGLFKGEEGVGRRGKGARPPEVRRAGDGGEHFGAERLNVLWPEIKPGRRV